MDLRKSLAAAALAAPLAFAATPSHAVSVGLELVLLVDVSSSVNGTEYNLQKQGYVQAFQNAAVQAAITGSVGGSIAVTYIEWSSAGQQSQLVGWTLINDAASANAFAAAINGTSRAFSGQTASQSALRYGAGLFGTETGGSSNGFESPRQVIDISGDGANCNDGTCTTAFGRDFALGAGVDTINGLAIGGAGVSAYYASDLVGGGGFVESVDAFEDFGAAIQRKLIREITGEVPAPATLVLFGAALLGLAGLRRKA